MNTFLKVTFGIGLIALAGFAGYSLRTDKANVGGAPVNYISGTVTNTVVSVTTSDTSLIPADPGRVYAAIVNDGANPIYLSFGATAIVNRGIRLNANGGSYEITQDNLYVGNVRAIASGGTSSVTVLYK